MEGREPGWCDEGRRVMGGENLSYSFDVFGEVEEPHGYPVQHVGEWPGI